MQLHVTRAGKGQPVVFIHGWGMHSAVWAEAADRVSQYACAVLVDLPGFGGSPYQRDYSLQELGDQLLQLAGEEAIWVGWSLGGLLALSIALERPQSVKKCLCVAASPCFVQRENWHHGMREELLAQFSSQLAQDYLLTMKRFFSLQTRGGTDALVLNRKIRRLFVSAGPPDRRALAHGLKLLQQTDLRDRLDRLACPLLLLLGENDRIVDPACLQDLPRHPRVESQVIAGAAHVPFLSHASQFYAILKKFVLTDE